ncbi:odorant receptor 49b-like [Anoplophora glabripennis]|uniref:odorant receptor 49b-like n=1 Tax=Anoplophora glabripennis TaxID=217634 RepID=UPI000C77B840|nr:odorant receptor 49b-like [Anoplophora glabripennis]
MTRQFEYTIEEFWKIVVADNQITFLLRHLKAVETFYRYVFIFGPFVFMAKPLVTQDSSIFNCYVPPVIPFPLFYILECYLVFLGSSAFIALNLFACSLIVLVAVQFRLLNLKIKYLNLEDIENSQDFNRFVRELKCIVNYQQFLMRYVKDLNKLFCVPVAFLMIISVIILCSNMYILSTNQGTVVDRSRIMVTSSCVIVEYFLVYGLPAQLLMDESAATADMIYHECKWYLPKLRPLRKDFLIMIFHSQKSICLRAGNYHVINNQTILLMLKTAYSFYAFLRKVT